MKHRGLEFFLSFQPYRFDYALSARTRDGYFAKAVEWETVEEGGEFTQGPMLQLPREDVQVLFDELWRGGFRPSHVESAESALGATKYHLEDMRRLVFKEKGE